MHHVARSNRCQSTNAFAPAIAIAHTFSLGTIPQSRSSSTSPQHALKIRRLGASNERSTGRERARQDLPFVFKKVELTQEIVDANIRQIKDIHPTDLSKTLEAHRASNKASTIRTIKTGPDGSRSRKKPIPWKSQRDLNEEYINAAKEHWSQANAHPKVVVKPQKDPVSLKLGSTAQLTENLRRKLHGGNAGSRRLLEYPPVVIQPICPQVVGDTKLPWYIKPRSDTKNLERFEKLSAEIELFHKYVRPSSTHVAARSQVIIDVADDIQLRTRGFRLEVFGSEKTGLALIPSDIDLRLFFDSSEDVAAAPPFKIRNKCRTALLALKLNLQLADKRADQLGKPATYDFHEMLHARYPLLQLAHVDSGLNVQVVASDDSSKARDLVQSYVQQYPGLEQVYSVVKCMLDCRGLTEVFKGGIGAYPLFMMVAASFRLNPKNSEQNLGEQLMSFLSLWSRFDTYSTGVSVEPAELFSKTKKAPVQRDEEEITKVLKARRTIGIVNPAQPYLLTLQDPADPFNDLTRKSFGIKYVQETLRFACDKLLYDVQHKQQGSLLAFLVGPSFSLHLMQRRKLEAFGERVLAAAHGDTIEEKLDSLRKRVIRALEPKSHDELIAASKDVAYLHMDKGIPTYKLISNNLTDEQRKRYAAYHKLQRPERQATKALESQVEATVDSLLLPEGETGPEERKIWPPTEDSSGAEPALDTESEQAPSIESAADAGFREPATTRVAKQESEFEGKSPALGTQPSHNTSDLVQYEAEFRKTSDSSFESSESDPVPAPGAQSASELASSPRTFESEAQPSDQTSLGTSGSNLEPRRSKEAAKKSRSTMSPISKWPSMGMKQ